MTANGTPVLIVGLLGGALLWVALPTAGIEFDGVNANGFDNRDTNTYAYDSLTIKNAPNVTLVNATIAGALYIANSHNLVLRNVSIGSTYDVTGSSDVSHDGVTATGRFTLNGTQRATLTRDAYKGGVRISDSSNVTFSSGTFTGGCLTIENSSNVTFSNATPADPRCSTTSSSSSSATSTPPAPSLSSAPNTTVKPLPTTTSPPYSTPTRPPSIAQNYSFELVGKTISQDLRIAMADRVVIRNSTVYGNLRIDWSTDIVLEAVNLTGEVVIENSSRIALRAIEVGGSLGFTYDSNFRVADGAVGGDLGCYRCSNGTFSGLRIGGQVRIAESQEVTQQNVQATAAFSPSFSPTPTREGQVTLNVTNSSLVFVHVKDGSDARVDVNAILGKARLEVDPSARGGPPDAAVRLDSRFEKLIEYVERGGEAGYDLSDHVVTEVLLADLPVARIQQERTSTGWLGRIEYALPNGGTLALVFKTSEDDPDHTKIDVVVDDYRFAAKESRLALQVGLASADNWTIQRADVEDRLTFHGRVYDGYFSWVHTVHVDGADQAVTSSVLEERRNVDTHERRIVLLLSYPQGRHLVHDPSLGLETASFSDIAIPDLGNVLVYGSTFVAVLITLWAIGQRRRDRS